MRVDPDAPINSFRAPRFTRDSAPRSEMKKIIIITGSTIGAFLIGWLFGEVRSTETWAEILSFQHEMELQREAEKAFKAYSKENNEIGIYSLQELLEEITIRQDMIGTEENESNFVYYRIQTHSRLSKLFGNSEESEFHRTKAIEIAEASEHFDTLFEEMTFEEHLAYSDSQETKNENQTGDGNSE